MYNVWRSPLCGALFSRTCWTCLNLPLITWYDSMSILWQLLQSFHDLFSRTTWVSWHEKGRTILDFNDDGWQWHQLHHMETICTTLQTDNYTSTPSLKFFYRPDALTDAQPTVAKHWRQYSMSIISIIKLTVVDCKWINSYRFSAANSNKIPHAC